MIQMFDVPTYLVPGNHDGYRRIGEDGLKMWKEYFGPHYYSFDYGNYHFQAINSYEWPEKLRWSFGPIALTWGGYINDVQLDWIENDLKNQSKSKLKFMFIHHNPIWDTKEDTLIFKGYYNRGQLLNLIDEYNVNMVLAGHVHFDNVTIRDDTIFLTTTTPESQIRVNDGYWGYRLIKIKNGSIKSYNYKEPKYSIPSYKINIFYENKYKVRIENLLEKNISVLVKFTVPNISYKIKNASIIQTRNNSIYKEYYLEANVKSNSNLFVSLEKK